MSKLELRNLIELLTRELLTKELLTRELFFKSILLTFNRLKVGHFFISFL